MDRKMWCYNCAKSTIHYKDTFEKYAVPYTEWICEDCGQDAENKDKHLRNDDDFFDELNIIDDMEN